jgi:hypothetical protein
MKIVILLIQWGVGLFLSLGAIGGFMAGEYLPASMALIVGLALLPPVAGLFLNRKKTSNARGAPNAHQGAAAGYNSEDKYRELISGGESATLEFKSTLRVDLKTNKPEKFIQHSVLKTIAAFLNSQGGVLIIGVDDLKNILGLDADFDSFSGVDKIDEFQKFLDMMVANSLGNRFQRYLNVKFPAVSGKTICVITINERSAGPVYLSADNNQEIFYIRRLASTIDLKPSEAVVYIREHWK